MRQMSVEYRSVKKINSFDLPQAINKGFKLVKEGKRKTKGKNVF